MAQQAPARTKIPTKSPQPARGRAASQAEIQPHGTRQRCSRSGDRTRGHPGRRPGDRAGVRDHGVPGPRASRAAGGRSGTRTAQRRQCEARDRGEAGRQAGEGHRAAGSRRAEHGRCRGADLIAYYLSPDRLPVQRQWSRKHAHTQRRLCERFAAPVIGAVPARTSRPGTCSRSSTPRPRRGRGPGAGHDLGPGHRGPGGRVPGQPAAGAGALAGRGPRAARAAGERRG